MSRTPEPESITELESIIAQEIRAAGGVIPFIRFMGLALYTPKLGYYERDVSTVGRAGDFITSASVGSLFGELLAFQFCKWVGQPTPHFPDTIRFIEAGAHQGHLAADILSWIGKHRPEFFERLQYKIIEPSLRRREWQATTLREWKDKVSWIDSIEAWSSERLKEDDKVRASTRDIIFSNEFLDAFPCHRVGWDATKQQWFEWGVRQDANRFQLCRMDLALAKVEDLGLTLIPVALTSVLPDGFSTERCPAAAQWWRTAARTVGHGYLVTFDYALFGLEFLSPQRPSGTLRAYYRHKLTDDLVARPGRQDLTAHVDFEIIQAIGAEAGLESCPPEPQERFLTRVFKETLIPESGWDDWSQQRLRQFQTLTHPEHFGRTFYVVVQRGRM